MPPPGPDGTVAVNTRWSEVERLFDQASALPEGERAGILAQACGGDAALCVEVQKLLDAARDSGDFLERKPLPAAEPATLAAGEKLGVYCIERLIGRGGMSEVYLARRADGQYRQQVAMKLLSRELLPKAEAFLNERQILAQLQHPLIGRLLDGGLAADGRPYMVMEYVEGVNLVQHCAQARAGLDQRLRLFRQVCEAVAYAHRNLVVHRDLKPANILVTADGQVKLLDFGIAKFLDSTIPPSEGGKTLHLTPRYAAPEQLQGKPVTTATDVYALGVLLHELLAGQPPFQIGSMPLAIAVQKILNETPAGLSAGAAANAAPPVPARLLRGDLDSIAAKALRKEPEARYASATELLADLERYQRCEPVAARGYALGYVLRSFARRNRIAFAAGLAVFAVLLAALGVSLAFYARSQQALAQATQSAATARAVGEFLNKDLFASIDRNQRAVGQLTVKELLDGASAAMSERFADEPETAAQVHYSLAYAYNSIGAFSPALLHARRAIELFTTLHGADSAPAVDALEVQVNAMQYADDWAAAFAAVSQMRDHRARQFGASHPEALRWRNQLAMIHYARGDYAMAERELLAVQEIFSKLPENPGDSSSPRWLLGVVLRDKGDFAAAERLQRADLAARTQALGANHWRTASARYNLGRVLTRLGRYPEAETELLQAQADAAAWLGEAHPSSAYNLWSLGELRLEQGRTGEAVALLERAYVRNVGNFGPGDQDGAWLAAALAEAYLQAGRTARALATIQASIEAGDKVQGAGHPLSIQARVCLAAVLRQQGKISEAWRALDGIPPDALLALPERHPILGELRREQGLLLQRQAKPEQARAALSESLAIHEFRYGAPHWRTQRVRRELAVLP